MQGGDYMLIHNELDNLFTDIAAIFTPDNGREIKRYCISKNICYYICTEDVI